MKELYIAVREVMVVEYMLDHPDASENEAYDKTADAAYNRYVQMYADMIDAAVERSKEL